MQAKNCSKTDVENLNNFKNNPQNNLDEETEQNLSILTKFIEYAKKDDDAFKYRNVFEILNVGENSISRLLEWLLNTNGGRNTDIEKIKYDFCSKFLKKFTGTESELEYCMTLNPPNNNYNGNNAKFDILLHAKFKKDEKEYIYVIENKKNANINCNKRVENLFQKNDIEYVTQVEMYNHIIKNYKKSNEGKYHEPVFLFICAHEFYLDNRELNTDINKQARNNLTIRDKEGNPYNKFETRKLSVKTLLTEKFNYKIVEHKELILILYNILREKLKDNDNRTYFDDDFSFIKPTEYTLDQIIGLIGTLLKKYTKNFNQKNIERLEEAINKKGSKSSIIYNIDLYPILKENSDTDISKSLGSTEINFKKFLNENDNENGKQKVLEILFRYIEYWELHNDLGKGKDNIEGYSKIVCGKYIQDVCNEIFNDSKLYSKLNNYSQIQKIIIENSIWKFKEPIVSIAPNCISSDVDGKHNNDHLQSSDTNYVKFDSHVMCIKYKRKYLYYDIDRDALTACIKGSKESEVLIEDYSKKLQTLNEIKDGISLYFGI